MSVSKRTNAAPKKRRLPTDRAREMRTALKSLDCFVARWPDKKLPLSHRKTHLANNLVESFGFVFPLYKMQKKGAYIKGYSEDGWVLGGPNRPDRTPISVFKALMYKIILDVLDQEKGKDAIEKLLEGLDISKRAPSIDVNPFYSALRAVGNDNMPLRGAIRERRFRKFITEHELSLFARQMLYAKRHKVKPAQLHGFLYQAGFSSSISSAQAENGWENDNISSLCHEVDRHIAMLNKRTAGT